MDSDGVALGQGVRVGLGVGEAETVSKTTGASAAEALIGLGVGVSWISVSLDVPEAGSLERDWSLSVQAVKKLIRISKGINRVLRMVMWMVVLFRIELLSYRTWIGLPN